MSMEPQKDEPPPERTAQILRFERKKKAEPKAAAQSPLAGLGKFAKTNQPDDFAHRQKTNAAAVLVLMLLVVGGVWLAIKLSELRKSQDCVMAGRRDCAQQISTPTIYR
jgi:hypothetical protein